MRFIRRGDSRHWKCQPYIVQGIRKSDLNKMMILSMFLSLAMMYGTSASPTAMADLNAAVELPVADEVNDLKTIGIANYYVTTPGIGTHKFHKAQKKNWNDARNTCLNEGGHLAVIHSEEEKAVVLKLLASSGVNEEVWLGIHELFKKDEWVSVKDERIDAIGYIYWRQGEPNNHQNEGEHCLVINQQGMNDQNCDKQFYFVCEM